MDGSTWEVHAAGSEAVVVRRATGPDAPRLRATGERLVAAAHPGVAEVVSSQGSADEWELRVVHAGRPVEILTPMHAQQVAAIAAALSATLADLHEAGIVHGRIDSSHVLIGSHGRPVLCGFGPQLEPPASPEDDIAAMGALIVELLGDEQEPKLFPDRRWTRPRREGWERRALLLVADHACAEPATRRPSARRLAAEIAAAVPSATITAIERHERTGRRLPGLVRALLGVAVLGLGAMRLVEPGSRPEVGLSAPPATTSTSAASDTREPLPREVVVVDGITVSVGERRYRVGQPGDLVVVGDWDGDGEPTPAVLRPGTGEVFVFTAWADARGDVVVEAIDRVEGARELAAQPGIGGDALIVRRSDGSWRQVPVEAQA